MLFLPAIVATWVLAGTLDFTPGGILAGKASGPSSAVLLALYVFGIGKAALMPLHFWLPAAMVAPTPVSALLHAVAVVKAGVFTVVKVVVYVFGLDTLANTGANEWLIFVASASLLARVLDRLVARQSEGAACLLDRQPARLCRPRRGARDADQHHRQRPANRDARRRKDHAVLLRGRHLHRPSSDRGQRDDRHRPQDAGHDAGFLSRSLSIIGLPPLGGTWSKWTLALGALDAGHAFVVGVLMLSSLLSVGLSAADRGARVLSASAGRPAERQRPASKRRRPPA